MRYRAEKLLLDLPFILAVMYGFVVGPAPQTDPYGRCNVLFSLCTAFRELLWIICYLETTADDSNSESSPESNLGNDRDT